MDTLNNRTNEFDQGAGSVAGEGEIQIEKARRELREAWGLLGSFKHGIEQSERTNDRLSVIIGRLEERNSANGIQLHRESRARDDQGYGIEHSSQAKRDTEQSAKDSRLTSTKSDHSSTPSNQGKRSKRSKDLDMER